MALAEGCPEVHHPDRGVRYTSRACVARLSYAGTGRPWENGHAFPYPPDKEETKKPNFLVY